MIAEGLPNSSTYTTPTPAPCSISFPLVASATKLTIVFGHHSNSNSLHAPVLNVREENACNSIDGWWSTWR